MGTLRRLADVLLLLASSWDQHAPDPVVDALFSAKEGRILRKGSAIDGAAAG